MPEAPMQDYFHFRRMRYGIGFSCSNHQYQYSCSLASFIEGVHNGQKVGRINQSAYTPSHQIRRVDRFFVPSISRLSLAFAQLLLLTGSIRGTQEGFTAVAMPLYIVPFTAAARHRRRRVCFDLLPGYSL